MNAKYNWLNKLHSCLKNPIIQNNLDTYKLVVDLNDDKINKILRIIYQRENKNLAFSKYF